MREQNRTSLLMIGVWLLGTLFWWALAFAPTSGPTPEWLAVARNACFGTLESGLPGPAGWLVLIMGPISFFAVLIFFWREEMFAGMRGLIQTRWGRVTIFLVILVVGVEASWVAQKISQGIDVVKMDFSAQSMEDLPESYPITAHSAPDFQLIDQHGEKITMSQLRGQTVVLTFAFAHCQTICPRIVTQAVAAMKDLPEGDARLVIITLDPWRDTPSALPLLAKKWKLPANAHILSGAVAAVTKTLDLYKVPWSRSEQNGDIAHPALTYVISPTGKIAYTFNNTPPRWLFQAVQRLKNVRVALGSP